MFVTQYVFEMAQDEVSQRSKTQTTPVVLVEVQPKAKEAQALVRAVDQQHQEVLDDALRTEEVGEDSGTYNSVHWKKHSRMTPIHV